MFCLAASSQNFRRNCVRNIMDYQGLKFRLPGVVKVLQTDDTRNHMSLRLKHQITYKPYQKPSYKSHDYKNIGLGRPMSPHVTIYAPNLLSTTSILQRITGIMTSFYVTMLSCGTLFLSNGVDSYVSAIQSLDLSRPCLFFLKLILGAPFAFHYFLGVRFCVWNAGKWLAMKDVYKCTYQAIVASTVFALLFATL